MATVPKNTRSTTINLSVSSAGPFDVGFRLFDTDAVKVYVDGVPVTAFTLTASLVNGYDDAATVLFASSITAPATIIIEAALTPWREKDLINGDQGLVTKLNNELARHASALAELRRDIDRSIRGFDPLDPVEGIDLALILQAEGAANAAAASANAAAASAAAAQAAQNTILKPKGQWLTATDYVLGDLVYQTGSQYECIAAHTSGTFATDLGAGRWRVFVSQGATGAGTGDVLAANAASEYIAAAGTVRSNLALFGALLTPETGVDLLARAASNPRGMAFICSTGCTNAPPGYSSGDIFTSKGLDSNNVTIHYVRKDGAIFTNARVSGVWIGWIAQATQSYVDSEIAATKQFLHVRDEKASGTHGGGSTAGSYLVRSLGTVVTNTIPGASLASNKITLPAGTYELAATAPGFGCGGFKSKIFNVTAAADLLIGSFGVAEATYQTADKSHVSGRFTLGVTSDIDLRMRCNVSRATNGLGYAPGYGDAEIYSEVRIWKIS